MLPSAEPTYTRPADTAGDESIAPPVAADQSFAPLAALSA